MKKLVLALSLLATTSAFAENLEYGCSLSITDKATNQFVGDHDEVIVIKEGATVGGLLVMNNGSKVSYETELSTYEGKNDHKYGTTAKISIKNVDKVGEVVLQTMNIDTQKIIFSMSTLVQNKSITLSCHQR